MRSRRLPVAATATVALLVVGCAAPHALHASGARVAPHATLGQVDLRYGIYLARLGIHTTIAPDGFLRSVRTDGKSYGSGDLDPKYETHEIREGRLMPAEIEELASLFNGWELLSDRYAAPAD